MALNLDKRLSAKIVPPDARIIKGIFLINRYYSDPGMEYCFDSLSRAFKARDVKLYKANSPILVQDGLTSHIIWDKELIRSYPELKRGFRPDFVIFWDKDTVLAKAFENLGIRVFSNSRSIEICDDKLKTYAVLAENSRGFDVLYPKTILAPLMYDVNDVLDSAFLEAVVQELKYPVIVKENTGSQGRQVYKAENFKQLSALYVKLKHIPHHYQEQKGISGVDLRIYVAGSKALAACVRLGRGFKSNAFAGGKTVPVALNFEQNWLAEKISQILDMDYGSVDFLLEFPCQNEFDIASFSADIDSATVQKEILSAKLLFLEANTNAYFRAIEEQGANISTGISGYIIDRIGNYD